MDMELNSIDNSSKSLEYHLTENRPMSTGSLSHYRLESSDRIPLNQSRKDGSMSIPYGSNKVNESNQNKNSYLLWVDGVGSYLIFLEEKVIIGGPRSTSDSADLALLSNLSRKHASIIRSSSCNYYLEAHSKVSVSGRDIFDNTYLKDGNDIKLGNSVKLQFCIPNALSSSAVLHFKSEHRPNNSVDAVILMHDSCLLGPGIENHIPCNDWKDSVILFKRENKIYCQSRADIFLNDNLIQDQAEIPSGAIVSGIDFRFRLEKF